MRKLLTYLFVLALAVGLTGDRAIATGQDTAATTIMYDADSLTMTYCVTLGTNNNPFGAPSSQGTGRIKTAGSSTSVTSDTALSGALAPISVNDIIYVQRTPAIMDFAIVVTDTDADNVVVDAAVNWPGNFYTYRRTVCGTSGDDGWVDTSTATRIMMTIQYDQGDLDNLAWRFECRQASSRSQPVIVYPSEGDGCGNGGLQAVSGLCDFATAGVAARFTWEEFGSWSRCRIGFAVKAVDASDAGANLEQVTSSIVVSRGSF
jgi:hypothetical protein